MLKKKSVVILTGGNFIFGKPPSADLNIFASKLTDSIHLNWRASIDYVRNLPNHRK